MSKLQTIPAGHITKPGKMTIIEVMGQYKFITDMVGIRETLEPGQVYAIHVNHGFEVLEFKPAAPLSLPAKIYDFEQDFRNQILSTLRNPNGNMNVGVLLEGYKGQGKSVIAKQLAIESGLPVVLINSQIPKTINFQAFLNDIKQDYVLLIDEFEKLFPESDYAENKMHTQDSFLSLLDGTHGLQHKRLVIFTTNKEVGDKFINRPSRIRYYKKYNYMPKAQFDAVVADKLKYKKYRKDLEDCLDIPSCTIDILTTIIEEINIHNKPYSEFKDFFNHKERIITYSKYRREADGTWKFVEDITTKKEIGVENEYLQNTVGYGAKAIQNDGETIIYEINDYVDPDNPDEKKAVEMKKFIFKLIKQKWEKMTLAF